MRGGVRMCIGDGWVASSFLYLAAVVVVDLDEYGVPIYSEILPLEALEVLVSLSKASYYAQPRYPGEKRVIRSNMRERERGV